MQIILLDLLGILEGNLVKVENFIFYVDFVVLEMDDDLRIPIILGRSFLSTIRVMIDVKNHKLSLAVGENKIEFDLSTAIKQPFVENIYCRVDWLQVVK